MPWYAQRDDLPDTHKMWADPDSGHEAVLTHLGYVEVTAPGTLIEDEDPDGSSEVDPESLAPPDDGWDKLDIGG